ncbi:unnamed protein product [Absidia cylindrospora]
MILIQAESPSHSLIFDLDDTNWDGVFSVAERNELFANGKPLVGPVPEHLTSHLNELGQLTSALNANKYARKPIDYDPLSDNLLAWLSMALVNTSHLFLKNNNIIDSYLETDKLYHLWGFFNTIFDHTRIKALGNQQRVQCDLHEQQEELSAVNQISNRKMSRKMDTKTSS